ncbi:hypothetical protein [Roseovarius sp. SYSU LYC5161]|uniref:hypothetical protein n=1 Tax=Roseovarius halophilus (ex Wu et al. 2025) TaxID=3376060 RepID=UPI003999FE4E
MDVKWVLVSLAINGAQEGAPQFSTAQECATVALELNAQIEINRNEALIGMPTYENTTNRKTSLDQVITGIVSFSENYKNYEVDDNVAVNLLRLGTELQQEASDLEELAFKGCDRHAKSSGKYPPLESACSRFYDARGQDQDALLEKDLNALPDLSVSCVPTVIQ